MNYKSFIQAIERAGSGLTYAASTGTTILKWIEFCLTDEPELDANTTYPAMFITPISTTIPKSDMATPYNFKARVYILDFIGLDKSLRLDAFSKCQDIMMLLIQYLEYNSNWAFQYPLDFNPILYYDANVDGGYMEISVLNEYTCPI